VQGEGALTLARVVAFAGKVGLGAGVNRAPAKPVRAAASSRMGRDSAQPSSTKPKDRTRQPQTMAGW
jgi:hypothetical protein